MGQYEPDDSRIVTNNPSTTPIEPKRTGPQEAETRKGGNPATGQPQQQQSPDDARKTDEERERWQVGEGEPAPEAPAG